MITNININSRNLIRNIARIDYRREGGKWLETSNDGTHANSHSGLGR